MNTAPAAPEEPLKICPLSTADIADKIITFSEMLMGVKYYAYQALFIRRISESVIDCDGAIVTGLWSRQSGKTEAIAGVVLGLAVLLPALASSFPDDDRFKPFKKGFRVGIYAPIDEQARLPYDRLRQRVTSEEGEQILSDPELDIIITASRGDRLVLSNGSVILSKTASPQAQIEGETHHLIILEEAQKILRSKVDKEIRPMLASTNGTMAKIGTAWESRGGFHHSIQLNIEIHAMGGKRNHFEFPYDIVIAEKERAYSKDKNPFHLNYGKFVNSEIIRLGGTDNEEFKMNFRCLWLESRVIAVVKSLFDAAAIGDLEAGPMKGGYQVAGLDIGKVNDQTVLTTMVVDRDNPVVNKISLPGADEEKQIYYVKTIIDWLVLGGAFEGNTGQYKMLIRHLELLNVKILVIDATSIGDPIYEHIQSRIGDSIECIPFKFSSMTKANLYKYYLQELHARRIYYAAGEATRSTPEYRQFCQEHLDLDRVDYGGYALCSAPDGGHDDFPDSAALACWAEKQMSQLFMPTIDCSSASLFGRVGGRSAAAASGRGSLSTGDVESSGAPRGRYSRRW